MHFSISPNPDVLFSVAYADDDLCVVDKPTGVVTEPGKKHGHDSLLNGLFAAHGNALQNQGEARDWGLLHRLDKDTSGLVLVALRNRAYDHLRRQFEDRQVKKLYWAIVCGRPDPAQGVIQKPIAEVTGTRKKAVLRRDGQPAVTAYRVLASADDVSLVEARPKTGRLHQIRVHLAALGCPVLGETIYQGDARLPTVPRLCLHAAELSFLHPTTGHRQTVKSPWPKDLQKTLARFDLPLAT